MASNPEYQGEGCPDKGTFSEYVLLNFLDVKSPLELLKAKQKLSEKYFHILTNTLKFIYTMHVCQGVSAEAVAHAATSWISKRMSNPDVDPSNFVA